MGAAIAGHTGGVHVDSIAGQHEVHVLYFCPYVILQDGLPT